MFKRTIRILAVLGGVSVLAIAMGVMALGFTRQANAQAEEPVLGNDVTFAHGGPGFPGAPTDRIGNDQYLADALGISPEELQAAQETARSAAIEQAVEQGLLTQEQAEALQERSGRMPFGVKGWDFGRGFGSESSINMQALLAEALGISVDELQTAQETAQEARVAQAIADGYLTEEQAAMLAARQALQAYLDPQTLMAEALGISVDELQSYQEAETSLSDILAEQGLTISEYRSAMLTAHDGAVAQAVADGVITQEQADQILSAEMGRGAHTPFGGRGGRGGPGDFGMKHGRPFGAPQVNPDSDGAQATPSVEGTSL